MLKLEDAVIHMQQGFKDVNFLFPTDANLNGLLNQPTQEIFSDLSLRFLEALSTNLMRNIKVRRFPDIATFAFFCRRSNLSGFKKRYEDGSIRFGKGIVFHITPSNVPVNFAYSMVAGILAGNINIVRVPTKSFEQVDLIINSIQEICLVPEFNIFQNRLYLIRYDRKSDATKLISSVCDVRVIWGGDETITQIRKSELQPRSIDITFADRYSLLLVNSDKLVNENNLEKLAEKFYNDTYLFDQNACSSPHLIFWTGKIDNITEGKSIFWNAIRLRIANYELPSVVSIDKLSIFFWQSTQCNGINLTEASTNKLWRVQIKDLVSDIEKYRCAGGYFLEYDAVSLSELAKIVNRKYQTLAYYGYTKQELIEFIRASNLNGIDRVVPIGETTSFDLIWDGYDLIRSLSRQCSIM